MQQFQNMQDWKRYVNKFLGQEFWTDFSDFIDHNYPKANLYEAGNELICIMSIPGIENPKHIDLSVRDDRLFVKGTFKFHYDHLRIVHEELPNGNFERSLQLPYPVRPDKVDATYKNGLLILHLHRLITSDSNKRKIQIKHDDHETTF